MGRQQKIYADAQGRQVKVEVFNADAAQSIYLTTTSSYNPLDQLVALTERAGASGAAQSTTMTYDGHARLKTHHRPEQRTSDNQLTATSYVYNPDDTVQQVTDGRGATKSFAYTSRHLVSDITYDSPAESNIEVPAPVHFEYDAAGNRRKMEDGAGWTNYTHDALSRLKSETRHINDLNWDYSLNYNYNLSDQLTSLIDPYNSHINYDYDQTGRLSAVGSASASGFSPFASNMQYRAWGAIKHISYGNTRSLDVSYNAQQQPVRYDVPGVMTKIYEYYADGQLRFSDDLLNDKYDRFYQFDQAGRVVRALSGQEARGGAATDDRPYNEQLGYDVWGHLTTRQGRRWNRILPGSSQTQVYTNNRNAAWQYDAEGQLTSTGQLQYAIDAAGRERHVVSSELEQTQTFDGEGHRLKTFEVRHHLDEFGGLTGETSTSTSYEIRSSVLGGELVTEIGETGAKLRTLIYMGGAVAGWQRSGNASGDSLAWEHRDAHNASYRLSGAGGLVNTDLRAELDVASSNVGLSAPPSQHPTPLQVKMMFESAYPSIGDATTTGANLCMADGVRRPCGEVRFMQRNGLADACETGDCGPAVVRDKKGNEYFAPLGRDPNTGGLGYWFRFITQTSSTVEGKTEHYPGRPAVMWMEAEATGASAATTGLGVDPQNPAQQYTQVYCQDDFIAAMVRAWNKTANGTRGTEAGFAGVKNHDPQGKLKWVPRDLPFTNEKMNEEGRENLSFAWSAVYQSIWHVHSKGGPPSDVDRGLAVKKNRPIYSFGPDGLYEYKPGSPSATKLRDKLDWAEPCSKKPPL
jgi:YD repeat-containing protein